MWYDGICCILYACDFEIAQNSNHSDSLQFLLEKSVTCQNSEMAHFFSSKIRRVPLNSKVHWILWKNDSNFELSQNFRTKKMCHLRILTRDRFFEQKLKGIWMVRIRVFLSACHMIHVSKNKVTHVMFLYFLWQKNSL